MRVITAKEYTLTHAVPEYERTHRPKSPPAWSTEWFGRDDEWQAHVSHVVGGSKDYEVLEQLVELTKLKAWPEEFIKVWPKVPVLTCCGNRVGKVVVINEELIEDYYDVSTTFCHKCATRLLDLLK